MTTPMKPRPLRSQPMPRKPAQPAGELGGYFAKLGELWIEAILSADLTPDERADELLAWAASHPALPTLADDSRESIYAGRGE